MKNIKYLPTIFTAISFLLLLLVCLFLFLGRREPSLRPDLILIHLPDFYQHVSNLCISYSIFSAVGYAWLLMGIKISNIIVFGTVIILANFIYELWISFLNTRDIVDAYYGCVGVIVAFIFLLLAKEFGLNLKK
ncbi:MAG: hypothetical protein ABIY62_09040 [Ginsengibacter sp.]